MLAYIDLLVREFVKYFISSPPPYSEVRPFQQKGQQKRVFYSSDLIEAIFQNSIEWYTVRTLAMTIAALGCGEGPEFIQVVLEMQKLLMSCDPSWQWAGSELLSALLTLCPNKP